MVTMTVYTPVVGTVNRQAWPFQTVVQLSAWSGLLSTLPPRLTADAGPVPPPPPVTITAQISGTTANDFTTPVTYTVTAADDSTQDYTVTVTIAP